MLEQGVDIAAVFGVDGDADTSRAVQNLPLQRQGFGQGGQQLLRHPGHRPGSLETGEQNHELVAALAGNGVDAPQTGLETTGHGLQKAVAGGMAEGIVDLLEAIKIEKQHRHPLAGLAGLGQHLPQAQLEGGPIGQAGEVIGVGHQPDLFFRFPPLGQIPPDMHHPEGAAVAIEQGGGGLLEHHVEGRDQPLPGQIDPLEQRLLLRAILRRLVAAMHQGIKGLSLRGRRIDLQQPRRGPVDSPDALLPVENENHVLHRIEGTLPVLRRPLHRGQSGAEPLVELTEGLIQGADFVPRQAQDLLLSQGPGGGEGFGRGFRKGQIQRRLAQGDQGAGNAAQQPGAE